ncbi:50S ribosomal protein L25 [Opitutia bacterium]|nr:50S ribosomal protein L25 [Opitutae bacterium]
MKKFSLNVTSRQVHGRGPARRLRLEGAIPAIIYGKSGNQSVSVKQEDFRTLMRAKGTAAALIDLNVDGKLMLSLIKESQRHPITQKFLHIDIMEIDPKSLMTAAIPVRAVGEAYGVKTEGGTLAIVSQTINVRCLPDNLPEFIEVDVTELKVNQSIHVGALKAPKGITFPGDPQRVVVVCSEMAEEEVAAEPVAGAAPVAGAEGAAAAPAAGAAAAPAAGAAAAPAAAPAAKK